MAEQQQRTWLELSEAAEFLGIHFTTLRRWADDGEVPHVRMPSGRRRFILEDLVVFLEGLRQGDDYEPDMPGQTALAPQSIAHVEMGEEPWYGKLDESQRSSMRNEGQKLMAVLMQYATRSNGGEAFLEEGRRLAVHYGVACYEARLSLADMVQAFIRVRRSIMDSVYQAGALAGAPDADTWRLYDRMNNFLDSMLLSTLEAYDQACVSRPEAHRSLPGGAEADSRG